MRDLFDQERITEMLLIDERWNGKTELFKSHMEKKGWSFEQTADMFGIPEEDWPKIKVRLR